MLNCPKGTRRNRRTGICEPKIVPLQIESVQAKPQEAKPQEAKPQEVKPQEAKPQEAKPQEAKPQEAKPLARCPKGTHRNKKTGNCDPVKVLVPKK